MELVLLGTKGIHDDCVLSIRAGSTRKQAIVKNVDKPFRFPASGGDFGGIKIEVLSLLGSARTVCSIGGETQDFELALDSPSGEQSSKASISFRLQPQGTVNEDADGEASHSAAKKEQLKCEVDSYIADHKVLSHLQDVLHSVIRERPQDPIEHCARHFTQATLTTRSAAGGDEDELAALRRENAELRAALLSKSSAPAEGTRLPAAAAKASSSSRGDEGKLEVLREHGRQCLEEAAEISRLAMALQESSLGSTAALQARPWSPMVRSAPVPEAKAAAEVTLVPSAAPLVPASGSAGDGDAQGAADGAPLKDIGAAPVPLEASLVGSNEGGEEALDELRGRTRSAMVAGLLNGSLGRSLTRPLQPAQSAKDGSEEEEEEEEQDEQEEQEEQEEGGGLRQEVFELLGGAALDGSLEEILSPKAAEPAEGGADGEQGLEDLQALAQQTLTQAATTGRLEEILAAQHGGDDGEDQAGGDEGLDNLQVLAQQTLTHAVTTGKLSEILASQRGGEDTQPEVAGGEGQEADGEDGLENLQVLAQQTLTHAVTTGKLSEILASQRGEEDAQPDGAASGEQAEAEGAEELENLQVLAQQTLTHAVTTGKLSEILACTGGDQEASSSEAESTEDVRALAREALEIGAATGSLSELLQQVPHTASSARVIGCTAEDDDEEDDDEEDEEEESAEESASAEAEAEAKAAAPEVQVGGAEAEEGGEKPPAESEATKAVPPPAGISPSAASSYAYPLPSKRFAKLEYEVHEVTAAAQEQAELLAEVAKLQALIEIKAPQRKLSSGGAMRVVPEPGAVP